MEEDQEKRLQRIMDRLYQFPKPKKPLSSGGGASLLQKGKRVETSSRGSVGNALKNFRSAGGQNEVSMQQCRPWDRGDLMRRLATFKAMTWFGKPKAVSPINCARRGWINVEMDTIACEACGSRILFSTPSSWTYQQVEKAAAVFSLKLDNGHKLLCPWMDNICDESLALFPPTPAPALVEAFKERSRTLLQLSALPVISASAIKHMKCPQLERLLEQHSSLTCTFDNGVKLIGCSRIDDTDDVPEPATSNLYFQAQKIISLCGWEVRILPYFVDCERSPVLSTKKATSNNIEHSHGEKDPDVAICTDGGSVEVEGEKANLASIGGQADPASAVLDCKLCGACVGLWTFESTPLPLEAFTLIDSEGFDVQNDSADPSSSGDQSSNRGLIANGGKLSLNLTIAGGVPPTKQDFKPRISLPIISRHLRARFDSNSELGNYSVLSTENANILKRKRNEDECHTTSDNCNVLSELDGDASMGNSSARTEEPGGLSSEGRQDNIPEIVHEVECRNESSKISDGNISINDTDEILVNAKTDIVPSLDNVVTSGSEAHKNDLTIDAVDASNERDESFTGENNSQSKSHCFVDAANNCSDVDLHECSDSQNLHDTNASIQCVGGLERSPLPHINSPITALSKGTGNNLKLAEYNATKEFDPIRQHRLFCPWISPMEDGEGTPGWKLTLLALDRQGGSPGALSKEAKTKPSDEADDPVLSVRKLFTTPPSKKLKTS